MSARELLYAADYMSVYVGFFAAVGGLLVYAVGGAVTRAAQWWRNDYGRMVTARGIVLAWLYYKAFDAVVFHGVKPIPDLEYEIGSVLFAIVMVWTFWIHIKLVVEGARLKKLRELEKQLEDDKL